MCRSYIQDLRFTRQWLWRLATSWMLHCVVPVRTDVSEEVSCVCWLLVTASIVPSSLILVTLMKEALSSSETSVLTRATRRKIPEDTVLTFVTYRLKLDWNVRMKHDESFGSLIGNFIIGWTNISISNKIIYCGVCWSIVKFVSL
jgi:hypothetical protein